MQACADQHKSLAQHHLEDVAAVRAQGHAYADFMCVLRGGVGDHAINTHHGQHQAKQAQRHGKAGAHAIEKEAVGAAKGLFHGLNVGDGKAGCEIVYLLLDCWNQRFRRAAVRSCKVIKERKFCARGW